MTSKTKIGTHVFFNNARMTSDALRFQEIVKEGSA